MRMVVVLTPILENLVGKENGYSIVECIKAIKKGFPLMFMRLLQRGKERKEIRETHKGDSFGERSFMTN